MEKHHKIPRSRGGPDETWNFVDLTEYEHAYEHALNFVLFEHAPAFDFRLKGWGKLPEDLKKAVLAEKRRRTTAHNKTDFMRNVDRTKTDETIQKHREKSLESWRVDLARSEKTSEQMRATNLIKKPCSKCGSLQNAGNMRKHMQGKRCLPLANEY
jgi:hypothetical protein